MRFGFGEIALLLIVVLIFFGAGRISSVMGEFGKGLRSFKKGLKDEEGAVEKVETSPESAEEKDKAA